MTAVPITTDPARLAQVAGELGAAINALEEGKRVRLPVIQRADAAGLTMIMHAELDDAIEDRSAEAAAEGHHIACSAGCSGCCVSPVLVTEGEAVTVAEWLGLPENKEIKERFLAAYPAWKQGIGDAATALERARGNDELRAAAMTLKRRAVMCAFNREGLCSIYDARPARCRTTHALDDNTHCGAESDGKVKYFEHVRTQVTFEQQEPMRAALHHAMRKTDNLELLPSAVARLLGTSEPGRNDPCPCGSGKKFKKCHGG
jgi:hypothetical protein